MVSSLDYLLGALARANYQRAETLGLNGGQTALEKCPTAEAGCMANTNLVEVSTLHGMNLGPSLAR